MGKEGRERKESKTKRKERRRRVLKKRRGHTLTVLSSLADTIIFPLGL